jgi:hypothetical protein
MLQRVAACGSREKNKKIKADSVPDNFQCFVPDGQKGELVTAGQSQGDIETTQKHVVQPALAYQSIGVK